VSVDDLDLVQLLVIDGQDNSLDGFQEQQPTRTHFVGEAIHRVLNIICHGLCFGYLTPPGLGRTPQRYSNNSPVERMLPLSVEEREPTQLVNHSLICRRSRKIINRTSRRVKDSRKRIMSLKEEQCRSRQDRRAIGPVEYLLLVSKTRLTKKRTKISN
jgi:hypothetical protein